MYWTCRRPIAVAGVVLFTAIVADLEAAPSIDDVGTKVTQLVDLLRDESATEYKEARDIHTVELGGGTTVAVAVFTLEGFSFSNDYTQFLAVFSTTRLPADTRSLPDVPPRLALIDFAAAGGRLWRHVEGKGIRVRKGKRGIVIGLDTVEFTRKDAACCPSKKSHATYTVELSPGSRLKEVKQ